jgi:molybdate transport system regulatory protein
MTTLRLRILFDTAMLGPGKAELLRLIRATGSISAAGRDMGMSYRRAWSLVEEMNTAFATPLVTSSRGGTGGGGAQLTRTALYDDILARTAQAAAPQIAELESLLRPTVISGAE